MVCVLVASLLGLSLLLIHPQDYTARQNNAQRWLAVAHQMQLLKKYADKEGSLPAVLGEQEKPVGDIEELMYDLCPLLVPKYTDKLIVDPVFGVTSNGKDCGSEGTSYVTGLSVVKTKDNKVTVSVPATDDGEKITLTRQF